MTLRTLNYGNYGIFLMGNAGFISSTVVMARGRQLSPAQDPELNPIAGPTTTDPFGGLGFEGLGVLGFRGLGLWV